MQTKRAMGRDFKVEQYEYNYRAYYNPDDVVILDTRYVEVDELRAVAFLEGVAIQQEEDDALVES